MKLLILVQGHYGQRMADNIKQNGPPAWEVEVFPLAPGLPIPMDSPEDFLPQKTPSAELLISLGEEAGAAELILEMTKKSGVKAVIAPADNRSWLLPGQAKQIIKELALHGVEMVSPVPFCSLTPQESRNRYIMEFATYFGRPEVEIDYGRERIEGVRIHREAPCGNTRFVAQGLIGVRVSDAVERAGLLHHEHPCLASMSRDAMLNGETILHRAGLMVKLAVEEAIKVKTPASRRGEL